MTIVDKLTAEGHKHPATAASEFFLVPCIQFGEMGKTKEQQQTWLAALRNDMREYSAESQLEAGQEDSPARWS